MRHIVQDVLADVASEGDGDVGTSLLVLVEVVDDGDLEFMLAGYIDDVAIKKGQMSVTGVQTSGGWDQVTYTMVSVVSQTVPTANEWLGRCWWAK